MAPSSPLQGRRCASALEIKDIGGIRMYINDLAKAAVDGVISIPMDLAYGARRTFEDIAGGKAVRAENHAERERAVNSIRMAIAYGSSQAGPISKMVKIILTEFYDLLPDSTIEEIAKKAGVGASFMTSRMSTQVALTTLVSQKIAREIAVKAIASRALKFGVGVAASALLIQGLLERASEASKRLQQEHPKIYSIFRSHNLDMAYILIEDSVAPILKAITLHEKNLLEFNDIIERIINDY